MEFLPDNGEELSPGDSTPPFMLELLAYKLPSARSVVMGLLVWYILPLSAPPRSP